MKILMFLFLLLVPVVSVADVNDEMKLQMLNSQIESLTKERDEKYTQLKQCEKKTTGFKIAGLSTLVATGFGVYGNIKLAQRLKEGGKTSSNNNNSGAGHDPRPEEVKRSQECDMFCRDNVPGAAEMCGC